MRLIHKYIQSRHWAMLDEYLTLMCAVAERDLEATEDTMELIQRRLGQPVHGTREVTVRDGIAVVPIAGPMFRYANLFTEISGAVSYERLGAEIGRVMENPDVKQVVYDINSPGGEVDGAGELADLIASFRSTKPQTAFISHLGASAGYWIAAAADRVVIAETAMAGSIGAVIAVTNYPLREGVERMEFVSAFAPDKRLDPFSDDAEEASRARAKLQGIVDKVGTVFAANVAEFRGMSVEAVMATQGGLFVGTDAVDVGLADGVGTLEQLVTALSGGSGAAEPMSLAAGLEHPFTEEVSMKDTEQVTAEAPVIDRDYLASNHADLVAQIQAEAAETERARIIAIHDLDAHGFDALKREAMENPKATPGTAAQAILAAKGEQEQRRKQAVQDSLAQDEGGLEGLGTTTLPSQEAETEDQVAASILKWMPTAQAESAEVTV